jgi:hypothetical protein
MERREISLPSLAVVVRSVAEHAANDERLKFRRCLADHRVDFAKLAALRLGRLARWAVGVLIEGAAFILFPGNFEETR